MKNNISVLVSCIDPIFLDPKDLERLFAVVLADTALAKFSPQVFPSRMIIEIKPKTEGSFPEEYEDLLTATNASAQFKLKQIKYYIVPHRSSRVVEAWAKKYGIRLIVTPIKIQFRLEDKIYFDRLLKKNKISSPPTLSFSDLRLPENANCPIVVQEKSSFGLFGTKFYKSASDFLATGVKTRNALIRKYLPEMPAIGVSVFLDKQGNYFFSALRLQCFEYEDSFPKVFLGIQWLPIDFFSRKTKQKLELILIKLVKALRVEGFVGVANFDVLIKDEQVFVLECNPRLSSATPQIFGNSELVGFKESWQFYLKSFTGVKNQKIKGSLPRSKYLGSVVDVDVTSPVKIKNILPLGWYSFDGKAVKYYGRKPKLKSKKTFFLFHDLSRPQIIEETTLCSMISDFPLYDLHQGVLNNDGKKLFRYFKEGFLGKNYE